MDLNAFNAQTNTEVMEYLRIKIRAERNRLGKTQDEMSMLAGIPLRTYKRFEQNCDGSIENLINVLRVLNKINIFQLIQSESSAKLRLSPIEVVEAARRKSLSRASK